MKKEKSTVSQAKTSIFNQQTSKAICLEIILITI